jgi:hypothetical protein
MFIAYIDGGACRTGEWPWTVLLHFTTVTLRRVRAGADSKNNKGDAGSAGDASKA